MKTTRSWLAGAVAMFAVIGLAASCAPTAPGGGTGPAAENWQFKGTSVTVNNVQDEVCVVFCVNREDEPYLLNVAFRVKIGEPGSAQAWVVGSRSNALDGLGAGQSATLTGDQQAAVTFNGVTPLDVLDLANTNNHLEVTGVYTWAAEEDTVGIASAANSTATVLKDALNSTLAVSSLPSDANAILDIILDNLGSAVGILASNIPLLGLGDDVLGGGMFIGIGATGTLASVIDASIASTPFPSIAIPVVTLPPDIQGGGFYTTSGAPKTFTQSFSGSDGTHTYTFSAAKI